MKRRYNRLSLTTLLALLLPIAVAHAATVSPGVANHSGGEAVYAKTELFQGTTHFTDQFEITTAGNYRAVLTDFEFPNPLADAGLNITTATTSLGSLPGPGEVSFLAAPGIYFVSLFAATGTQQATVQAQRFSSSASVSDESVQARRYYASGDLQDAPYAVRPGGTDFRDSLGQYGLEIALLQANGGSSLVPLPASVWLFAGGLAGLVTVARRRQV